jgi:hypothetical protein
MAAETKRPNLRMAAPEAIRSTDLLGATLKGVQRWLPSRGDVPTPPRHPQRLAPNEKLRDAPPATPELE